MAFLWERFVCPAIITYIYISIARILAGILAGILSVIIT